ncbi:transposase [Pseudonocardia halophobica]|uniref:transposase n=1 Tax=Pseudonocardia halophobica TaxID=29401 RepID=UPI003D8B08FA
MTLDQSALLEVLETLKAAYVEDRVRSAAETIYQALIEAELTSVIDAAPHERSHARTDQRNGHRPRTLTSTVGDLELRIPKLRTGSFFPSLLERRRRIDQALFAVVRRPRRRGRGVSRPLLSEQAFPYVFLDATYCKARVNRRVVSQAVVVGTGVAADGRREAIAAGLGKRGQVALVCTERPY